MFFITLTFIAALCIGFICQHLTRMAVWFSFVASILTSLANPSLVVWLPYEAVQSIVLLPIGYALGVLFYLLLYGKEQA